MLEAYLKEESIKALETRLADDAAAVKQELGGALDEEPLNVRAVFTLARSQLLTDEAREAKQTLETLLERDPNCVPAKLELAAIYNQEGDSRGAIRLLTDVTNARPEITATWRALSEQLKADGQAEASEDAAKQHAMIKAYNEKLHLAEQAFARRDFRGADTISRNLLRLVPNEFRALRLLSRIARQFHQFEFSASTLERCVETRPQDVSLGLDYAYSLVGCRRYKDALAECDRLISIGPEVIEVYDLKAEVLFHLSRYDEAIALYRELAGIPERRAISHVHLGKVLKTVGDADEASASYQHALEAEPALGQAYWELADLKTFRFSDDHVAAMREKLDDDSVSAIDKIMIGFALGKALEDAGDFEESFQRYDAANKAYAAMQPGGYASQNDRFVATFTADFFAARKEQGSDSGEPIFVVGLPRSGTTLLEQILSCHSQVDATQELDEIVSIARATGKPGQPDSAQYPEALGELTADEIQGLAQRYLDFAQSYRQQAPFFVDKAPHNFQHIGLIKTLFPRAKVIDVRRNPMASGWSLYRQFFADSYLFSYNLETIGKYYSDYLSLMNHWHEVLPGEILTVNYEDIVRDLRGSLEAVLDYCGLEFEEACLDFHLNKRAVATPSSEQVRQPLYSDALNHWKNFEAHLEPLQRIVDSRED